MKRNVVIEVPVTTRQSIKLPPPCTYCGKQIDEPRAKEWEHKVSYISKHWVKGKWGWAFYDMTNNGVSERQSVTICAPYCAQHVKGVKLFTVTNILSLILMFAVAISAIAPIVRSPNPTWNNPLTSTILGGGFLIIGFFVSPKLAKLINNLIAKLKPELRDYPKNMFGHWGLEIGTVRVDPGKEGVGPIQYFLKLGFFSVESAQRFLAAYPDAIVIEGDVKTSPIIISTNDG